MNNKNCKNIRAKSNTKLSSPQNLQKWPLNAQNRPNKEQTQPSATSPKHKPQHISRNTNFKLPPPPIHTRTIIQSQINESRESSLAGSSLQKQQLLQLQIKQLKRQNQFLRKKIQQLTALYQKQTPKKKKPPISKGHQAPSVIPSMQLSVNYFFKQISTLLNSVAKIFNLDISQGEKNLKAKYNPDIQHLECPIQRQYLFKKQILNKKLERMSLQTQQQKYKSLLDIFEQYYKYKEEAEQKITSSLDQMIQKANELNKRLLQKAQVKKMKSQIYSVSHKQTINTPNKPPLLKIPQITTANNRLTFSPVGKNTHIYTRKVDLSPQ